GGSADEVLGIAQAQEEAVGRRVPLAQAPEDLRGGPGAGREERLARDDLEQVAALEGLAGHADEAGVVARRVVAGGGPLAGARVRAARPLAREAVGAAAVHLELVAPALGDLAAGAGEGERARPGEHARR